MKFRERGKDKPTVELKDRDALVAYLREQFRPWPTLDDLDLTKLECERYGDLVFEGNGFEKCYLISVPGYGAVGYANEPLMPGEANVKPRVRGAGGFGSTGDD